MKELDTVTALDIPYIIIGFILLCAAVVAVIKLFDWIIERFGIQTKSAKQRKEDHELLLNTANDYKELRGDLLKLTNMVIDKHIDDMRYEILDFASALSNGRKCSKEQFDHVINIHKKYEKILEENGLKNGQVDVSMEFVNEVYKEKLKNGF